ncbi:cytidine monophosphate-N-acetylneuraminic acid hydroxylase-like [Oreochromis niloticus]|uniref:cytidine monophosphate-N-acetylneuraminic acid hydroxylase-like n=1 Tax=Oreochromis niloticus TaxID=8128 RepID=UPI0003940030|nr:cytidine monophosphate-N-acetylneuraminic acid hydroxylase-like [Oreochromis niloticus]
MCTQPARGVWRFLVASIAFGVNAGLLWVPSLFWYKNHSTHNGVLCNSNIQIKNRIGVMRYVVLHGCLWDDLYIGFQNRISRDPDIYHHKFWKHFQAELPLCKPDWEQFQKQVAPISETGMGNNCALS